MPKKKVDEPTNKAVDNAEADEEEDTVVVKALKANDEKYCAIEKEFELEADKLRLKFKKDHAHLLEERSKLLDDSSSCPVEDKEFGTPACKGFWLQAFQNCEEFSDKLEKYDEPILEYLHDVKTSDSDEVHERKGTILEFFFKANPFFTNEVLKIEIFYDYDPETFQPWQDLKCREVRSSAIDWKAGKNVTVEVTQKKAKGGGAKKAKQKAKAKEEPRPSFFRIPFCNLKAGEPVPESLAFLIEKEDDDDDDEGPVNYLLMCVAELCEVIDERITKYAVRYYTGEAGDDDDDFSEDGEEESQASDDEETEDSEDEPPARGKGKAKAKAKAPKSGGGDGQKQEECKQQ